MAGFVTYIEHTFYSPFLDCEATRISVPDARGGEFYMIVPRAIGMSWRKTRDEALDNIATAIEQGCEPGEVRIG